MLSRKLALAVNVWMELTAMSWVLSLSLGNVAGAAANSGTVLLVIVTIMVATFLF